MDPEIIQAAAIGPETLSMGVWVRIFTIACYVAAAGSIYHGIREGARTSWRHAAGQVVLFSGFALTFWAVESWAHHRTPYYVYATAFWDLIPRIDFAALGVSQGAANACTELVTQVKKDLDMDRIPLGVVLMAASLTYSAMWTARRLGANLVVQPLLAGLVMVNIDLLLDPVLASTNDCIDGTQMPRAGIGLGLWVWYLDPGISGEWFDVPVFNYAAWFSSPVILISLTNLAGPFLRDWLMPRARKSWQPRGRPPEGWQGLLLLLVIGVAAGMYFITPGTLHPWLQWGLMAAFVGIALVAVAFRVRHFDFDHAVDPTLTRPTALALTVPAVALCLEGFFMEVPTLIPVAIFSIALGLLLAWLPCESSIFQAVARLANFDRFARAHYFGFTAMMVFLGAAAVSGTPGTALVVALLMVAVNYHVFGYVLNDVVDLDLDRQQERRGKDPLVCGLVSRESALASALIPLPVLLLVGFLLGVQPQAWAVLGGSVLLAVVYDVWGKKCPVPPLTDLAQGLAWASLGLFAALCANPGFLAEGLLPRLLPLLVYGCGFILLINGIHGGLRDLYTDVANGKKTTAIFLGAQPTVEDPKVIGAVPAAESPRGVRVFSYGIHTLMFAPMFLLLRGGALQDGLYTPLGYGSALMLVSGLFFISNVVLWRVVEQHSAQRGWWVSTHLFVLLLPPLAFYLPAAFIPDVMKVVVATAFFVPLLLQVGVLERLMDYLRRARSQGAQTATAHHADPGRPLGPPPPPPPAAQQGS